jgi:hypothetical protein
MEGLVPFGTLGSDLAPPPTAKDQVDLGAGQLLGTATAIEHAGELSALAGTLASAGALFGASGFGAPIGAALEVAAAATEIASVVVAAGVAVNAASGVYNMAAGAARGGGGASGGYPPDRATRDTKDYSAQFNSEGEARAFARQKVGRDPVEVEPGKLRSQDGRWQYRAKPNDLLGHGPGDSPHIHLEQLDPRTGEVLQNWHLRW